MSERVVFIDGIALWAPTLPGWHMARAAFRGECPLADPPLRRPAPAMLPPAERRRLPDSVALALEVAAQAVAQSGLDAADLASVFTSAHGDLHITDYMCSTLVHAPRSVSPTRFHNSVHNAASGYWTMATGCMQASTAVSAYLHSFAAGWLEAAAQCAADDRPVLLVGGDIDACGALASTNASRGLLGVALVLSPKHSAQSLARVGWSVEPVAAAATALRSAAARSLSANAMADALPLFEAFARCEGEGAPEVVRLPLSGPLGLPFGLPLGLQLRLGAPGAILQP